MSRIQTAHVSNEHYVVSGRVESVGSTLIKPALRGCAAAAEINGVFPMSVSDVQYFEISPGR